MTVDSWERSTQTKPWRMKQSWHNLLFAHWPVPIEDLQRLIPAPLQLDIYEGQAWVGVVPFYMSNIRYRNMPYIPTTSKFAELNVRTYVTLNKIPGVYFFSLDATSFLAVKAARYLYHLPYHFADINIRNEDQRINYNCRRIGTNDFQFKGSYKPISSPFKSHSGTLEHWLTERYCFYNSHLSRIFRCDILHKQWSLQHAEADIYVNTMANIDGLQLPNENPLLHYSERLDVLTWGLEEVVMR